jgi:uncharacterized protein (TIGR03085 family)
VSRDYPARVERDALCDLLAEVGPDQPTLCEGWTARDLAAHIIVRERRPDAALGVLVPPLRARSEAIRAKTATSHTFGQLIDLVRRPPALSMSGPALTDRVLNTAEFFIHHEDVRRGRPGWQSRTLDPALEHVLHKQLKLVGRLRLRRFPARLTIRVTGDAPIVTGGAASPDVELSGDVGELTLFLSGRQRAARVDITGPEEIANRLRAARLGI